MTDKIDKDFENGLAVDTSKDSQTVQLNIKSPPSSFQDIRLECPTSWTVTRLKQQISQKLQFKVSPKKQRLVYAGKILEDTDLLKNVIRFQDECSVYTILLVSSEPNKMASASKPEVQSELRRRKVDVITTVNTNLDHNPGPSNNIEMNSWASQYLQLSNQIETADQPAIQMAAMQEMYSQYLMQYMQYIQTSSPAYFQGLSSTVGDLQQPATTTTQHTDRVQQVQDAVHQQQQQQAVQQPQPPRQQNQQLQNIGRGGALNEAGDGAVVGGAAAAGAAGQRDALDWVYSCVRVLFLVSLVYFYSSLPRFLLVLGIFFAFNYFQRDGNNQERINIQQLVNNIRDNQQQQPINHDHRNDEDDTNATEGEGEEAAAANVEEEQEAGADIISTITTFILSFFTSLLPEPNQQLID